MVFDEFFYPGLARENVTRHVLKLLWYIHPKLPVSRLNTLVKMLQPTYQHNEAVHSLYELLREKIDNDIEPTMTAVSPDPDYLDSPLMSVPTPAPL